MCDTFQLFLVGIKFDESILYGVFECFPLESQPHAIRE